MTDYVELQVLTHFSLLRGASSPEELFAAAALLGYMALFQRRRPDDAVRIDALARQAGGAGVRAVVTGDVLYHAPEARLLQDVVTAVREKCTVDELGYRREVNADRALKSSDEMVRRFKAYPDALRASVDIARLCTRPTSNCPGRGRHFAGAGAGPSARIRDGKVRNCRAYWHHAGEPHGRRGLVRWKYHAYVYFDRMTGRASAF